MPIERQGYKCICIASQRSGAINQPGNRFDLLFSHQLVVVEQVLDDGLDHEDVVGHVQVYLHRPLAEVVFNEEPRDQRILLWLLQFERPFAEDFYRADQSDLAVFRALVEQLVRSLVPF